MRIVGLDPSLRCTGIARPDGVTYSTRAVAGSDRPDARLYEYADRIGARLAIWKPDVAVMEDHGGGPGGRQVTLGLAELHGAIKVILHRDCIARVPVNPGTLKAWASRVLGGQRIDSKDDMVSAAIQLGYAPANHDEADAALLHSIAVQVYRPRDGWPELTNTIAGLPWPTGTDAPRG